MAKKQIKSRPGLFGTTNYYDENGKFIGKSRPGLFGGTKIFTDANGAYAGKSRPGLFADEVFTDEDHNRITSYQGFFGKVHYKNGARAGHSRPGLFGSVHTTIDTDDEDA